MKRIAILEGLRGWLACWVMVSHILLYCAISSANVGSPFLRYLAHIPEEGRTAVWLFMILSGFVNFYLLDSKREKVHVYLTRRFLRLYPVFALLFAISLPINFWNLQTLATAPWANDGWIHGQYLVTQSAFQYLYPNLLAHGTLLHGLIPSWAWPHASSAFLGVDWSISTEWQFYLLAPLLFAWVARKSGLLWIGLLSLVVYFSYTNKHIGFFSNDHPSLILFKFHLFFIGIVSYLLYRQFILRKSSETPSLSQLAILGAIILYLADGEHAILLWSAIFLLTLLAEKNPTDARLAHLAWIFANRWSQYLGKISYSIYLSHWLVIMLTLRLVLHFDPHISSTHAALWMFPAVIAATLLISHILYQWVEEPCIRFGKRLFHEDENTP